jgi:peptide/nickel transport system substrate-binding protein
MSASCARASACIIAAFAAVATACSGDARRTAPDELPVVRIGTFLAQGVSFIAGVLSAEPLIAVGWDGRPVYRLAESAAESKDGRTLIVNLRPNLRFHSGEPVTAERVRELLMAKIVKLHNTDVDSIEALGANTLIVRLTRPGALKPVDLSDYGIEDDQRVSLRTGPFRITSVGPPTVLEPFAEYILGKPAIPRVEVQRYANHRTAWTAMMRDEVNFLHEVNREAIEFIEAGGHVRAYPLLRPYVVSLVFNTSHPLLQRREVRIALNEAVNRDDVVLKGMRGHGQAAEGPFWLHHWAYPPGRQPSAYNPEASRIRLDAAGLPVEKRDAQAMPSRFAFTCLLVEGDLRFERIALIVQRQLSAVGVDMQLRLVSLQEFRTRAAKGDFDAFIHELSSGRTLRFPYIFWHSKTALLRTGYSAADAALDRMTLARTDDDVKVGVADVMRILRADPPAIFLAYPREARAIDRSFEVEYETDRDIFGTFWQLKSPALRAAAKR